jgi:hypothetical protein
LSVNPSLLADSVSRMRFMLAVNLSLETSRLQAQPVKLAIRYR